MQTLYLQEAWEQTISPQDRAQIESEFSAFKQDDGVYLSFIREAVNYKEERLITVLIHNQCDEALAIEDTCIGFASDEGMLAQPFVLPLTIPPRTSMPWTFIFTSIPQQDCQPTYWIE